MIFPRQVLRHKDVFTLGDRSFRWEYPDNSKYAIVLKSPPRTPNKKNNALTPKSPSNATVKTSSAKKAAALQRVMSPKKAASSPLSAKKLAAGNVLPRS